MFIDPPTPILPSKGNPKFSATLEFPPSAPTKNFDLILISLFVSLSKHVEVTPSLSSS